MTCIIQWICIIQSYKCIIQSTKSYSITKSGSYLFIFLISCNVYINSLIEFTFASDFVPVKLNKLYGIFSIQTAFRIIFIIYYFAFE